MAESSSRAKRAQALAQIRRSVRESGPRLTQLLDQLDAARLELRRAAHSLVGKAPMAGLEMVGKLAAELEGTLAAPEPWAGMRDTAAHLVAAASVVNEEAPETGVAAEPGAISDTPPKPPEGILVAMDDDADLLQLIQAAFQASGWEVRTASTVAQLDAVLASKTPSGIILDVEMPEVSGFDLFLRLRERPELKEIPVMFLTSRADPKDVMAGLGMGSDDYLVKPIQMEELVGRVVNRVENLAMLRRQARRDMLTGLANRRAMEEELLAFSARHRRHSEPMAVAMLDMDHFKRINDTFGHAVGDVVLKETAHRLATGMRQSDLCGRWGGEEFLVLFPYTPLEPAVEVIDRLRRDVGREPMKVSETLNLTVTFSAGVAAGVPGDENARQLVEAADVACYRAKQLGRNRVVSAADSPE
ncbi:MAG: diguanylate cyclase [Acidobacteriota bacterium]